MPAILPRGQRPSLGCSLSPSAGFCGSGHTRPRLNGVLLRHCDKADPGPAGGPEAETTSSQDHHCLGALLLRVLAALRRGHLCGCSAAFGGPASQLQTGGCSQCVAGSS